MHIVRLQSRQKQIFLAALNSTMDTRVVPEEAPEILPSGDPEWFPNRTFVPKFLDNFPESGQQLGESYSHMQRHKRSCPPPSPPNPQTREWDRLRPETCMNPVRRKGHARQVPRTQRETTGEGNRGRWERTEPKANARVTLRSRNPYTPFACQTERKGCWEALPPFPDRASPREVSESGL